MTTSARRYANRRIKNAPIDETISRVPAFSTLPPIERASSSPRGACHIRARRAPLVFASQGSCHPRADQQRLKKDGRMDRLGSRELRDLMAAGRPARDNDGARFALTNGWKEFPFPNRP